MGYGDSSDTVLRPLMNRPPDQVAFIVEDHVAGAQQIGRMFGIARWLGWRYTADYVPSREYRGEPGDFESLALVADFGPQLELIAPLSGRSVFADFLERSGPGLHHLGYFVDSVEREKARLESMGLTMVQSAGGHGLDGDGLIAYFEVPTTGAYLELIQPPARRSEPHFVVPVEP